jgi:hypothetical protein
MIAHSQTTTLWPDVFQIRSEKLQRMRTPTDTAEATPRAWFIRSCLHPLLCRAANLKCTLHGTFMGVYFDLEQKTTTDSDNNRYNRSPTGKLFYPFLFSSVVVLSPQLEMHPSWERGKAMVETIAWYSKRV